MPTDSAPAEDTPVADDGPVVYDLDGTLVRLDVDWQVAEAEILEVYADAGVAVEADADPWALVGAATDHGLAEEVESVLGERERGGAERGERLPLASEVPNVDAPIGVCSLNCEAAVRIALERFDLAEHVDAVVGRDTVAEQKPHPQPLEAALDRLGVAPAMATFVGDSASDRETARAAGVDFQWVEERLRERS